MELLKRGSTRLVIILGPFVIKFPRRRGFLKNLVINFREFLLYLIYHPGICMPTYFSLFGFFNIQKRGKVTRYLDKRAGILTKKINEVFLLYASEKSLSSKEYMIIGHDLLSPNNLFWDKDFIKSVDYGSLPVCKFMIENKKLVLRGSSD